MIHDHVTDLLKLFLRIIGLLNTVVDDRVGELRFPVAQDAFQKIILVGEMSVEAAFGYIEAPCQALDRQAAYAMLEQAVKGCLQPLSFGDTLNHC